MPIFETVNVSDSLMHVLSGVNVINQEVIYYSYLRRLMDMKFVGGFVAKSWNLRRSYGLRVKIRLGGLGV